MEFQLIAALVLGIGAIVAIVLWTRLDAFIALLVGALLVGFVAGAPLIETIDAITTGFGDTMGSIGIVIGLGIAIGKILEVSGGADALAQWFLRLFGRGREDWAMGGVGAVVSIPVFCDSGFVIMNPLARSIARRLRGRYVTLALALGCGMTLTHHMVPPTPGPLAAAGILGANLGTLIVVGLIFTVILLPIVVYYARWMGPKLESEVVPSIREAVYAGAGATAGSSGGPTGEGSAADDVDDDAPASAVGPPPEGEKPVKMNAGLASLPLVIPLLLIVANTVTEAIDRDLQGVLADDDAFEPSRITEILGFVGNPNVALLIGILLAVYVLLPRWTPRKQVSEWLAEAASAAGLILLITGAGGALGEVLRTTGVGDALAQAIASWALPGVLVPFLVATLVRLAQGSGTVAMITAASVTAPMVPGLEISPVLAALACCAGSMVFSYFNDSYFWVVTRFTGLDGMAAIKGWSGITTAVWLGSLPLLLIASVII